MTTSYEFSGDNPFPEITICPQPFNQWSVENYPKPYNENYLKTCGLTYLEYKDAGKWVGKNNKNCTDPTVLSENIFIGMDDLQMEMLVIQTFGSIGNPIVYYMNNADKSKLISWRRIGKNHAEHLGWGNCYSLVMYRLSGRNLTKKLIPLTHTTII